MYKKAILFFVIINSMILFSFAFPDFNWDEFSTIEGENINLTGEVSYGARLNLYLNQVLFESKQLIAPSKQVLINGDFQSDILLSRGQTLFIVNNHTQDDLLFEIQGDERSLVPGAVAEFTYYEPEAILIRNIDTNNQINILIEDVQTDFVFESIEDSLYDGSNQVVFEVRDLNNVVLDSFNYNIDYKRYENSINIDQAINRSILINKKSLNISGNVELSHNLYYTTTLGRITNPSQLTQIPMQANSFNFRLDGLFDGNNVYRFISINDDIITGEQIIQIEVDRVAPRFDFNFINFSSLGNRNININSPIINVNSRSIDLGFSTDANNLTLITHDNEFIATDDLTRIIDNIDKEVKSSSLDANAKEELGLAKEKIEEVRRQFIDSKISDINVKDIILSSGIENYSKPTIESILSSLNIPRLDIEVINFEDNSGQISLDLNKGSNKLLIIAQDKAGNTAFFERVINFDDEKPSVVKEGFDPQDIFKSGTKVTTPYVRITGETNKPNVDVRVFTIPSRTSYTYLEGGETKESTIDCTIPSLNDYYFRTKSPRRSNIDPITGNELAFDPESVSFSFMDTLANQFETKTNSGSASTFDANLFFRGPDYDPDRTTQPTSQENIICILLKDDFGNTGIHRHTISYEMGNLCWQARPATVTPNTLYSADIEGYESSRGRTTSMTEIGVTVEFRYVCDGKVTGILGTPTLVPSQNTFSGHNQFLDFNWDPNTLTGSGESTSATGRGSTQNSRVNYVLNVNEGTLLVHFPFRVRPLNVPVKEYPDRLLFNFEASISHQVEGTNVPIDRAPVVFPVEINIENPFDHSKWLTPENIDKTIEVLNKSIEFTQQAVDITRMATLGGVGACFAARLYHQFAGSTTGGADAAAGAVDDTSSSEAFMYRMCDRVACTPSPQRCEAVELGTGANTYKPNSMIPPEHLRADDAKLISQGSDGSRILGQYDNVRIGRVCDYLGDGSNQGVMISGELTQFEEAGNGLWFIREQQSVARFDERCVFAQVSPDGEKISNIQLDQAGGACFNPKAPNYDGLRCNFFVEDEGGAGWNSQNNLIESIRCGCITDTYSHLNNWLKIQTQLRGCLQQARIGQTQGSYCERLLATAVCDVASSVMFQTISQASTRTSLDTGTSNRDPTGSAIQGFLQSSQNTDRKLNQRYGDESFFSAGGLGTQQLANKMCLLAITGDWSMLTDDIFAALDRNQVEPSFGPPMPESRFMHFDPISGDITINYRFTYAVVSGGQRISTEVKFLCDSARVGGNYCPPGLTESSDTNSNINIRRLRVAENQLSDETIDISDTGARYRFNVLELTHTYEMDGKTVTKVQEQSIIPKGELFLTCSFQTNIANPRIICDPLFTPASIVSLYSIRDFKLLPEINGQTIYYPGNNIWASLTYDVRDGESIDPDVNLAYMISCPMLDGGVSRALGSQPFGEVLEDVEIRTKFYDLTNQRSGVQGITVPILGQVEDYGRFMARTVAVEQVIDNIRVSWNGQGDAPENFVIENIVVNNELIQSVRLQFRKTQQDIETTIQDGETTTTSRERSIVYELQGNVPSQLKSEGDKVITFYSQTDLAQSFQIDLLDSRKRVLQSSGFVENNAPVSPNVLENVRAGICTVDAMIVPSGLEFSTPEQFNAYSPFGDNIQTNLDMGRFKAQADFTLMESGDSRSQIADPLPGTSVCLSGDNQIRVTVIEVNTGNNPIDPRTIRGSVELQGYRDVESTGRAIPFGINEQSGGYNVYFDLELPTRTSTNRVKDIVDWARSLLSASERLKVNIFINIGSRNLESKDVYLVDCKDKTYGRRTAPEVSPSVDDPVNEEGSQDGPSSDLNGREDLETDPIIAPSVEDLNGGTETNEDEGSQVEDIQDLGLKILKDNSLKINGHSYDIRDENHIVRFDGGTPLGYKFNSKDNTWEWSPNLRNWYGTNTISTNNGEVTVLNHVKIIIELENLISSNFSEMETPTPKNYNVVINIFPSSDENKIVEKINNIIYVKFGSEYPILYKYDSKDNTWEWSPDLNNWMSYENERTVNGGPFNGRSLSQGQRGILADIEVTLNSD